jgi:hypothetical protein
VSLSRLSTQRPNSSSDAPDTSIPSRLTNKEKPIKSKAPSHLVKFESLTIDVKKIEINDKKKDEKKQATGKKNPKK